LFEHTLSPQGPDSAGALDNSLGWRREQRSSAAVRAVHPMRQQGRLTDAAKLVGRAREVGTVSRLWWGGM